MSTTTGLSTSKVKVSATTSDGVFHWIGGTSLADAELISVTSGRTTRITFAVPAG